MILLLSACTPQITEVTLYGTVYDAPKGEGSAVADATLTSYEDDTVTEHASTTSDEEGIFYLPVSAGVSIFLTVAKEGYTTTSFSTISTTQDFYAGDGLPWLVSTDWTAALRERWAGCPGADGTGAIVVGEARYPLNLTDDPQDNPLWPGASVSVTASDLSEHTACYLDADGNYDPSLTATTESGAWILFEVPAGPSTVMVTVPTETSTASEVYEESIPEGGLVGMYPAFTPDT